MSEDPSCFDADAAAAGPVKSCGLFTGWCCIGDVVNDWAFDSVSVKESQDRPCIEDFAVVILASFEQGSIDAVEDDL